jgi:8-oxo-dGTP pyrophosphatase MutT (NUDIX family)
MTFSEFQSKINHIRTTNLGGLKTHFLMAPGLRKRYDALKIKARNPKRAAVLVLFYPDEQGQTRFLLTQRASYKGTHSAQISFPGGKIEKSDIDLKETAIREAFEEVGIQKETIEIIREITDVYIPPSNFLATPFIGFTNQKPVFKPNYEVALLIETLASDLLNDSSLSKIMMNTSYMKNIEVPCFTLNEHIVWGATAMMLSEIKELLK